MCILLLISFIANNITDVITPTEEVVVNQRETSTRAPSGVGIAKVNVRENLDPRDPKAATRWLFTKDLEVSRRGLVSLIHLRPHIIYSAYALHSTCLAALPIGILQPRLSIPKPLTDWDGLKRV